MGLSDIQIKALKRRLSRHQIRTRSANGKELSYIEGWHAIDEANRIFGFDGWDRETLEFKCVAQRESRESAMAAYIARVRITVHVEGRAIIREGHGSGQGYGSSAGEAHDMALKTAETDATKRALATFGNPFGLGLYRGDHARAERRPSQQNGSAGHARNTPPQAAGPAGTNLHSSPSAARPEPDVQPVEQQEQAASSDRPVPSAEQGRVAPSQIASASRNGAHVTPIERLYRRRDKHHLGFVAAQPCLICGRAPSDAHHLRFAQPRAMGRKVSDEFAVPLCRTHHRQLHKDPDERNWWQAHGIEPLEIARMLWEDSHADREQREGDDDKLITGVDLNMGRGNQH